MKRDNITIVLAKFFKELEYPISAETIYEELLIHPDYPSLLAISDVLANFHIGNSAYAVENDDLENLTCPLIVNTRINKDDFLLVNSIDKEQVIVSSEKWHRHKMNLDEFKQTFNGAVLTAERSANRPASPSFFKSLYQSRSWLFLMTSLLVLISSLLLYVSYSFILNFQTVSIILTKSTGFLVAILLLIQSIDKSNSFVQKLCKIGTETNCDDILSSRAAKVFEGLTWSELGFFYFTGTLLLFLFGKGNTITLQILAFFNLVSLPYTFYSIYYQAKVAKKWCLLCCIVQAVFWLEFIPLFAAFNQPFVPPGYEEITLVIIAFLLPITGWILLKPVLFQAQELHPLKQALQKFKYNTELFNHQLAAQTIYMQPDEAWSIVLGSKEAQYIITMATNPYCPPCAKTHEQLHQLLKQRPDLQARIVFTTDNSDHDARTVVARHLMALNTVSDKNIVKQALHDWYKAPDYESWARNNPAESQKEAIEKLDKQITWCATAKVTETPTLLLNGQRLPNLYQLSDLKYLLQS